MVSTGLEETESQTWATVIVSDTGETIPEEDLPQVFERFLREEEPRSMRVSETGLRLMIVKGVVELHGGRVKAESPSNAFGPSGEEAGSTFRIWLPVDVA